MSSSALSRRDAVLLGSPASAATPWCTGVGYRTGLDEGHLNPWVTMEFPAHSPGSPVYHQGYLVGQGHWTCTMSQGSVSEAVRALQHDINACYAPHGIAGPITPDGEFGPRTRAALVNVQRFHHLSPDGTYGRMTSRSMLHRWSAPNTAPPNSGCAFLGDIGWPGDSRSARL